MTFESHDEEIYLDRVTGMPIVTDLDQLKQVNIKAAQLMQAKLQETWQSHPDKRTRVQLAQEHLNKFIHAIRAL